MEKLYGEYLDLVEDCIAFARIFMSLPNRIEAFFEDCPSKRFPIMDNAAESHDNQIFFNKPWFTGADRWLNHRVDIEFFVFHELRHLHQFYEIDMWKNGRPTQEKNAEIAIWQAGFLNYKRNVGGVTQSVNITQEVEIDANAYALCISNILHAKDNMELIFSVPLEAMNLAEKRSQTYYETRPELKRCIDKAKREMGQLTMKKPGRNDLCPCGSGSKFKKCCYGKGIYD